MVKYPLFLLLFKKNKLYVNFFKNKNKDYTILFLKKNDF